VTIIAPQPDIFMIITGSSIIHLPNTFTPFTLRVVSFSPQIHTTPLTIEPQLLSSLYCFTYPTYPSSKKYTIEKITLLILLKTIAYKNDVKGETGELF
jgi:hypothetical protein